MSAHDVHSSGARPTPIQYNRTFDAMVEWEPITPLEHSRIQAIVGAIPADVNSIIDVGCGDGRVTNLLAQYRPTVGVDTSIPSLRNVRAPAVGSTVVTLPFRDGSFDLVGAFEVLEHLPDAVLAAAITQLSRVARRYILVTVPNRQVLLASRTRCTGCRRTYDAWGHLRCWTPASIRMLFPNAACVRLDEIGQPITGYAPLFSYFLLHRLGVYFWWTKALCPFCGRRSTEPPRLGLVQRLAQRIHWHLEARAPKRHPWLLALFELR